jgi:hypothetical protein
VSARGARLGLVALALALLSLAGCGRFRHAVGPDQGRFVASRTGHSYHLKECGQAKHIKPKHLLFYASGDEAYKDGFTPCHVCHPDAAGPAEAGRPPDVSKP